MGSVVTLPLNRKSEGVQYADRLKTSGKRWVLIEKKLLDQAEFLEAMILVLDDVKLQNIRNRDFAMMEIVSEEIPRYQKRLEDIQLSLTDLRQQYLLSQKRMAN